jgi:hypothetical protein
VLAVVPQGLDLCTVWPVVAHHPAPATRSVDLMAWLIGFTDDELNAIYNAIEDSPRREFDEETTLASVLEKITPTAVGNSTPSGAVER